jgi:hypothetical protein
MDFHVPRLLPILDAVRAAGGKVETEFRAGGPRPVGFCSDPFGNGFCVTADALE